MKLIIFGLIFTNIICSIFGHENHGFRELVDIHHVHLTPEETLITKQTYEKQKCESQRDCDRGYRDPRYRCITKIFSHFNLRSHFPPENICVPFRCYRDLDCLDIAQKYSNSIIYKSKGCKRRRCIY